MAFKRVIIRRIGPLFWLLGAMKKSEQACSKPSIGHRLVTAAFGVFFTFVAIILYFVSDRTVGPLLAALVIGFVGVNAIVSAFRNKPSLLSRIGPLP